MARTVFENRVGDVVRDHRLWKRCLVATPRNTSATSSAADRGSRGMCRQDVRLGGRRQLLAVASVKVAQPEMDRIWHIQRRCATTRPTTRARNPRVLNRAGSATAGVCACRHHASSVTPVGRSCSALGRSSSGNSSGAATRGVLVGHVGPAEVPSAARGLSWHQTISTSKLAESPLRVTRSCQHPGRGNAQSEPHSSPGRSQFDP